MMRTIMAFLLVMVVSTACNLGQTPTATPPDLPTVRFVAPANNARILEGTDVTVDIYAADERDGIARVEFRANGILIREGEPEGGTAEQFRAQMSWQARGLGLHILSAIAYRPDGTASNETYLTVEVVDR